MSGVDTIRGIAYQQAQAVLEALALLDDGRAVALRVEGVDDVVDVEILDHRGLMVAGKQYKTRADDYVWAEAELLKVMRRWAELPSSRDATFEFVTDGRLGPSGEAVAKALCAAADGDPVPLAQLLGEDRDSLAVRALSRARVRRDPVGVGPLLLRAERQVMALSVEPMNASDARRDAQSAVNCLFALLMERAGHPDAERRVLDRAEIAAAIGVPGDQTKAQRWSSAARDLYLQQAAALVVNATKPFLHVNDRLLEDRGSSGRRAVELIEMLDGAPALLYGRTGEGKSTACKVLVRDAALLGKAVLLGHAEAYLPGRLPALAADAMSGVLSEPMPASTGRQALADPDATLVIDGVSEIPAALREALADELRATVASRRGASIVLVGRDVAALRATLPTSSHPKEFSVAAQSFESRLETASRVITGSAAGAEGEEVRLLVSETDRILGDAAGNTLLFAMAVRLLKEGTLFNDRVEMYSAFVERLAQRSGAEGMSAARRLLGVAFARLLDDGRRYADPYEWRSVLREAGAALELDAERADTAARRSGLITTLGYAQTVVPMHDSFADYLAGAAHAAGLCSLPDAFSSSDEQRVLFAAAIGGLDSRLAAVIVRDLPFLAVRLAEFDRRQPDTRTPMEVSRLFQGLTLGAGVRPVALWQDESRVVAFADTAGTPRWISNVEATQLARTTPHVAATGGPLALAIGLWRQELRAALRSIEQLPSPRPQSAEDAAASLRTHVIATSTEVNRLLNGMPVAVRDALHREIGPLGMTAVVARAREARYGVAEWPIRYSRTEQVDICLEVNGGQANPDVRSGQSTVDHVLSSTPSVEATKLIRDAINRLADTHWISS